MPERQFIVLAVLGLLLFGAFIAFTGIVGKRNAALNEVKAEKVELEEKLLTVYEQLWETKKKCEP